ncbi:MAG: asparagine synthase-related protein [Kiritimatiellia bacterium]|jgi:asparagine synthase (glutamine-hydrolysing)|nr:asparagine synthase-related protein [Kiritimatiellia bacterium]
MPGFLIQINKGGEGRFPGVFETAAGRLSGTSHETVSTASVSYKMARVIQSPLGHSFRYDPVGIRTWVYGAIYPRRGEAGIHTDGPEELVSAALATTLYLKHGNSFVEKLNGEFHMVLLDERKQELLILNDRFGTRPWYVFENESTLVLSPEAKGLFPYLNDAPKLNHRSVAGLLAMNKLRLGDETVIEDVTVLPPAQLMTLGLEKPALARSAYWQFAYSDDMNDAPVSNDALYELIDVYRDAMVRRSRVHDTRRVGISLSGGLDSRTMVGALSPDHARQVSAHTYGLPDSDEVRLAEQVAEAVGMPQTIYPMDAPDFATHAAAGMQLSDELDIFVQGCQNHWLQQAKSQLDVVMTGVDLDVTLGGIYLTPDVLEAKSNDDVLGLLKAKNRVFSEEELDRLFAGPLAEVRDAPYQLMSELIAALPQDTAPVKYDLFVNQYSMRRIIFLRYGLIRNFVETAAPMYDYDFIDHILALPAAQRAGHQTFHSFLNTLAPDLARIPYQRTMLPATVPVKYWAKSAAIEAQREKLYLDIWRETGGQVHVPYRRYYTNFDEWLRMDPTWLAMTDDLLGNKASQIYERGLIQPEFVATCISEHRAATRSWRQPLICLMSLELYLRAFFA